MPFGGEGTNFLVEERCQQGRGIRTFHAMLVHEVPGEREELVNARQSGFVVTCFIVQQLGRDPSLQLNVHVPGDGSICSVGSPEFQQAILVKLDVLDFPAFEPGFSGAGRQYVERIMPRAELDDRRRSVVDNRVVCCGDRGVRRNPDQRVMTSLKTGILNAGCRIDSP